MATSNTYFVLKLTTLNIFLFFSVLFFSLMEETKSKMRESLMKFTD